MPAKQGLAGDRVPACADDNAGRQGLPGPPDCLQDGAIVSFSAKFSVGLLNNDQINIFNMPEMNDEYAMNKYKTMFYYFFEEISILRFLILKPAGGHRVGWHGDARRRAVII